MEISKSINDEKIQVNVSFPIDNTTSYESKQTYRKDLYPASIGT